MLLFALFFFPGTKTIYCPLKDKYTFRLSIKFNDTEGTERSYLINP